MIRPILSIIIINYKTPDLTIRCLQSIFKDKGLEFDLKLIKSDHRIPTEVILIDNNSDDGCLKRAENLKKPIKIINNIKNVGFAQANNQGLSKSLGNYLLFLNSDTEILHSSISQSMTWLSSHPEALACTAQLLNTDNSIQASGGYFPNIINIATWCLGIDDLPLVNKFIKPFHPHTPDFYTRDSFYLKDHPQDWITGAFILIRKYAVTAVKGFDQEYFMYGEELELFYRIHKIYPNSQVWYLASPQIIHHGRASSPTSNRQYAYDREYEGILFFFKKHKSLHQYQIIYLLIMINRFFRKTIYRLFPHD